MSDAAQMSSNRPYLLRALYQWIEDNQMTPYLLVDASREGVQVPPATIKPAVTTIGRYSAVEARAASSRCSPPSSRSRMPCRKKTA